MDELFDELIEIGLNCFNPFQPEVMDVEALLGRYRGRLAFHGGLSTQRTLPYGTPDDVRRKIEPVWEVADSLLLVPPAYALPPQKLMAYAGAIASTFYG